MKLESIEQVNLAACGCKFPTCPPPRIQSTVCGYVIGTGAFLMYSGYIYSTSGPIPEEFAGKMYKTVSVTKDGTADLGSAGSYETHQNRIFSRAFNEAGSCLETVDGSATASGGYTVDYEGDPPEGDYLISYSTSTTCGPGLGSCTGTETYVYSESGSVTNPTTGIIDIGLGGDTSSSWTGPIFTQVWENGSVSIEYKDETYGSFKVGVPSGYPTSTFEVKWDLYFFTEEWDEWKEVKGIYDAAVAAHDAWELEDPDTRGPEPEIPDEPGSEPTPPTFVNSGSWVWPGSLAAPWSGFYEKIRPDGLGSEVIGETRVVNLATYCWVSVRKGRKPSFHGERYTPPV